jgi:hypothetical protein
MFFTQGFSSRGNGPTWVMHTLNAYYLFRTPFGNTRWFKYDKLWLVYTQSVPVILEPPCILLKPGPPLLRDLPAGQTRVRSSVGVRDFPLVQNVYTYCGAHSTFYSVCTVSGIVPVCAKRKEAKRRNVLTTDWRGLIFNRYVPNLKFPTKF